jgi:antitoxin HigA-1
MKSLRDPKRAPSHPGALLRADILPALKMTQTEFAQRLGVSRLSVSDLLHERRALTPNMAVRIAKLLRTTPDMMLRMQAARDLWEAQQHPERIAHVRPLGKLRLEAT